MKLGVWVLKRKKKKKNPNQPNKKPTTQQHAQGLFQQDSYLLTYIGLCPMRSIGHGQQSTNAPNAVPSSPAPSRSDRFSAFLPRCLCAICSWGPPLFLFSCGLQVRACLVCCWQASRGCGRSNPTFSYRSVLPLVLDLLSSTGPCFLLFFFLIFSGHRIQRIFEQAAVVESLELMECCLKCSP